ncbi:hypothetical protein Tco_1023103 [Tanacetum coccineum]
MAPAKPTKHTISQQAFNEMVQENINDLGMDPTEALSDAIETLTLQNVDLSGIITSTLPGQTNPVIQSLDRIKDLLKSSSDDELVVGLLDELVCLCDGNGNGNGNGNVAVAGRNGVVELMCEVCGRSEGVRVRVSALKALALFLCGIDLSINSLP